MVGTIREKAAHDRTGLRDRAGSVAAAPQPVHAPILQMNAAGPVTLTMEAMPTASGRWFPYSAFGACQFLGIG